MLNSLRGFIRSIIDEALRRALGRRSAQLTTRATGTLPTPNRPTTAGQAPTGTRYFTIGVSTFGSDHILKG